jgi:hypothetical protein
MEIKLKNIDDLNRYFFGPEADKDLIYDNIFECIKIGVNENLEKVNFCTITFEDGDESIDMICNQDSYLDNLDNVLNWYEETDQFEKCIKVSALKYTIKNKSND